jgi:hypothetical protein
LPEEGAEGIQHYVTDNIMALDLLGSLFPDALTIGTRNRVVAEEVLWCAPEVMRVSAEQDLALTGELRSPEAQLQRANELARAQGALAWELRCSLSLARVWVRMGREHQAYQLLVAVYAKFSEGRDTADLREARATIQRLRAPAAPRCTASFSL